MAYLSNMVSLVHLRVCRNPGSGTHCPLKLVVPVTPLDRWRKNLDLFEFNSKKIKTVVRQTTIQPKDSVYHDVNPFSCLE